MIEICELLQQNSNNRVFWHREMSVPYVASKSLWIGFDNVRSVTLKVKIKILFSLLKNQFFSFNK